LADSKKILKGLFYTLGSGYVARGASVALTFLIRHELGTDPFDATVWAVVVFALLANLSQFGLIHSLLHYQDDVDQFSRSNFVRTHFTISLLIGIGVFLISAATAFLIDYDGTSLGWTGTVILTFSGLYLLRTLSVTPEALLRKDFEHRSLSLIHGFGTIAALAGTLWLAHTGFGAISFIIGGWSTFSAYSAIYILIFTVSVWMLRPVKVWPLQLDPVWTRRILSFGVWVWLSSQLQNFVWFYDKLVMPYFVSATELSLYENTWWLMQIPAALITHVIMNYTVTVYAKVKDDRDKLSLVYTRALTVIVRVSAPAALLLVVCAEPLVTLMGPSWAGSIPIFIWLAPYAFIRPLIEDGLGLLWSIGQTRSTARVLAIQVLVALIAVPASAHLWGVQGVSYAVGLTALVGGIGIMSCLRQHIDLYLFRAFGAPVLAVGVAALAAVVLHPHLQTGSLVADLISKSALTSLVYLSILWIAEKRYLLVMLGEIRQIMSEEEEPSGKDESRLPVSN
jgi:O-antigen/teichoic acid export membrane protein